ncbi:MAG: chaperone NapD [Gammaproteobacteria bacterium]|nr:chaperone NapD [Gammaproteobacteria bacterium]
MHIAGVALRARREQIDTVCARMNGLPGVEVHGCGADGRLVVVIDRDSDTEAASTLLALQDIKGVLSACLVYQYSD